MNNNSAFARLEQASANGKSSITPFIVQQSPDPTPDDNPRPTPEPGPRRQRYTHREAPTVGAFASHLDMEIRALEGQLTKVQGEIQSLIHRQGSITAELGALKRARQECASVLEPSHDIPS